MQHEGNYKSFDGVVCEFLHKCAIESSKEFYHVIAPF